MNREETTLAPAASAGEPAKAFYNGFLGVLRVFAVNFRTSSIIAPDSKPVKFRICSTTFPGCSSGTRWVAFSSVTICAEGNFRFNESGISFKAIDPSQIVLVSYFIEKKCFDKFDIEPTFLGIDLAELNKIMQRILLNDKLSIDVNDSEMLIKLEGELLRSFQLPLIDVAEEEINIPSPKFDATVQVNARILREALKDASLFGSSVILRIKGSEMIIEARGSQGNLKTIIKESKNVSIKANADVTSKYSLNFLQNIVKEADPDKKIQIEIKSDAPMRVSYPIGEGQIIYHLAHMIL